MTFPSGPSVCFTDEGTLADAWLGMSMRTDRNPPGIHEILAVGLMVTFSLGAPVRVLGEENDLALRDRFLQEAPEAWRTYEKKARSLQGRFSFHMSQTYKGVEVDNTYEMKANANGKLVRTSRKRSIEGKTEHNALEVVGFNRNYAFVLKQRTDKAPWILAQLIGLRDSALPPEVQQTFDIFEQDVLELVTIRVTHLVDLVEFPGFRVSRARKIAAEGREMAEITFECPHNIKDQKTDVHGGILVMDPARLWCLTSYEVQTRFSGGNARSKRDVLEYAEDGQLLPVPKRVVQEVMATFDPPDPHTNKQTWQLEYDLTVPRKLPKDEEFTLSAFGLPEPPGLSNSAPIRWYLWASVLGIGCLVLAGLLRWRARRSERIAAIR
jgi:hypothetical protein